MIATVLRRSAAAAVLFAGLAAPPALAGDKPATAEGAKAVQAFFDGFLPAPAAGGAPPVSVKVDGPAYAVSADLTAIAALLRGPGAGPRYEPSTLVYRLFEQDDGKWRIVQDALPHTVVRNGEMTSAFDIADFRQTLVVDPAIAWWTSGEASASGGRVATQAPEGEQSYEFGPLAARYGTTVGADGAISSTVRQEIDSIAFRVAANDKHGQPVSSSGRLEKASFSLGVDGLKSAKLFSLLSLVSAHRADLATRETEVKTLLRALAEPGLRLVEGGEASKLMVASPVGAIALSDVKLALGVTNAGPDSAVDATFGAEGLSLPAGLAPPNAADLTPSKIDLAFSVKGIDIAAAARQAIDSLRLDAPGPRVPDDDLGKVTTALLGGAGPLKVVLAPSHVVAPAIDADLTGEARYVAGKTSGTATVRMRGFDRTIEAVKALGPDLSGTALPILGMAKILARSESDGSLTWLIEVGDDRSIRINGVPLGKSPG